MKQIITIVALAVVFLNVSLAAATTEDKDKTIPEPVPEVIKCEASGSCEMTKIENLPDAKKEKKAGKK